MTNNDSTAEVVGVIDAYSQALQAGDKDTILGLYADEPEIIPDSAPSLRGADAVDSFYTGTFATIKIEGSLQVVSAEVHGEIALVRCEEPVAVVVLADGARIESYFRELFVLRHTPDGWRIHKYMYSENAAQA